MVEWDFSSFWEEALRQIEEWFTGQGKVQEFNLWFTTMNYEASTETTVTAAVPSNFVKDQVIKRGYINIIKEKIYELSGKNMDVQLSVKPKTVPSERENTISDSKFPYAESKPAPVPSAPILQNTHNIKETLLKKHPGLREDYNFQTFVPGDNNIFAYNAAIAISKNPGKAYNPVLFYGGVGLGKTHLMEAIGNYIYTESKGSSKVIYVTAESFTNEFIQAIGSNDRTATSKFKAKYRNADVLLIDDIHFLQNKTETQEELFHTFNTLYDANRQLVFTCDRPISELKNIAERLKSRFERGLSVDMQPPAYETRKAILEKKLSIEKKSLPNDIIDLIAQNVATNVRDLEASLTKLLAYIELTELANKKITVQTARQLLQDTFKSPVSANVTVENIQRAVADHYNISYMDMKGKKKSRNIVLPRQIAMYIARELTEYSTTELGMEFGNRDHTTVMHSCQKIEDLIHNDPSMNSMIQQLIRSIKEHKK